MTKEPDALLSVRGLRMRYDTTDVLKGVDLDVRKGEVLVVVGPQRVGEKYPDTLPERFGTPLSGKHHIQWHGV